MEQQIVKNELRKPLKIAMLGHKVVPSRRGGVELVLTTLAPILVSMGNSVTCYNRRGSQIENEYIGTVIDGLYKGVIIKTVPAINKRGIQAVSASFFSTLFASLGSYDIVHFHAEGACSMMWIAKIFHKHCVVTVHGLDWQRDKWKNGIGSKIIKIGEKQLVKNADAIIVLSKNTQAYFKEKYNRDTIFIPNGVEKPVLRKADIITNKFGLKKNEYFLLLSRLTEEKDVLTLIRAYKELCEGNHTCQKKLVIAGAESDTKEYYKQILKECDGYSNIILTGFVTGNELDELYSNAYVYCITSKIEGMPLGLLEAMSYGNAVIASNIPEITEVICNMGITFETGNQHDLKEKMNKILNDSNLVEKLKKESSDYILKKYNWLKIAQETIDVYYEVLNR